MAAEKQATKKAPFYLGDDFRMHTKEEIPELLAEREKIIAALRLGANYEAAVKEAEDSLRLTHARHFRGCPSLTDETLRKSAENLLAVRYQIDALTAKRNAQSTASKIDTNT